MFYIRFVHSIGSIESIFNSLEFINIKSIHDITVYIFDESKKNILLSREFVNRHRVRIKEFKNGLKIAFVMLKNLSDIEQSDNFHQ